MKWKRVNQWYRETLSKPKICMAVTPSSGWEDNFWLVEMDTFDAWYWWGRLLWTSLSTLRFVQSLPEAAAQLRKRTDRQTGVLGSYSQKRKLLITQMMIHSQINYIAHNSLVYPLPITTTYLFHSQISKKRKRKLALSFSFLLTLFLGLNPSYPQLISCYYSYLIFFILTPFCLPNDINVLPATRNFRLFLRNLGRVFSAFKVVW